MEELTVRANLLLRNHLLVGQQRRKERKKRKKDVTSGFRLCPISRFDWLANGERAGVPRAFVKLV
jgi:hypothetical protein